MFAAGIGAWACADFKGLGNGSLVAIKRINFVSTFIILEGPYFKGSSYLIFPLLLSSDDDKDSNFFGKIDNVKFSYITINQLTKLKLPANWGLRTWETFLHALRQADWRIQSDFRIHMYIWYVHITIRETIRSRDQDFDGLSFGDGEPLLNYACTASWTCNVNLQAVLIRVGE